MNLDGLLSQEQEMIHKTALQFAQQKVAPEAAERDRTGAFPEDLVKALGEMGFLGIKVPAEDGGSEADMTSYGLVISAIAQSCASMAVTTAVCNLCADVLSRFGNAEQKAQYLVPYLAGTLGAGTFCLSEPGAGSDAAGLKTTARAVGDDFIIDGAKQWITNGAYAPFHLVFARTDPDKGSKGITCFLVERGTAGLTVGPAEKKMGLRSSNTVPLTFEGCRVPKRNIVGELGGGYKVALAGLDGGRIGIAAQAIGIAEAALDEGIRYALDRKAFGKSVAQFQNSQFAIADSRADLDQAWLLLLRAAHQNQKTGRSARESSMAKVFATDGRRPHHRPHASATWWLRLRRGLPHRAPLSRRSRHPHLRGYKRGSTYCHCARSSRRLRRVTTFTHAWCCRPCAARPSCSCFEPIVPSSVWRPEEQGLGESEAACTANSGGAAPRKCLDRFDLDSVQMQNGLLRRQGAACGRVDGCGGGAAR